jgi:hypothetical protein
MDISYLDTGLECQIFRPYPLEKTTCRVSVDNIPRLWRYLVCQEALEGLSEDLKAKLRC